MLIWEVLWWPEFVFRCLAVAGKVIKRPQNGSVLQVGFLQWKDRASLQGSGGRVG